PAGAPAHAQAGRRLVARLTSHPAERAARRRSAAGRTSHRRRSGRGSTTARSASCTWRACSAGACGREGRDTAVAHRPRSRPCTPSHTLLPTPSRSRERAQRAGRRAVASTWTVSFPEGRSSRWRLKARRLGAHLVIAESVDAGALGNDDDPALADGEA